MSQRLHYRLLQGSKQSEKPVKKCEMFCARFDFLNVDIFLIYSQYRHWFEWCKRSPTTTSKLVIWMILWTLPTVMLCKTENIGARLLLMINKSRCKATSLREKKRLIITFHQLEKMHTNYHTFTTSPSRYAPVKKRNLNPVTLSIKKDIN